MHIDPASCRIAEPRAQAPLDAEPICTWDLPDGSIWLHIRRVPEGFHLRFPDLADVHVGPDGREATFWPVPGLDDATRDHLILNQVLPLMSSQQGKLVLHAAAVQLSTGCIAFVGPSGRGKSTLTASFATSGSTFLTDDGLVLEREDGRFVALPSHPSVRLWEDSETALLDGRAARSAPVSYTDKVRLRAGAALPHWASPSPLRAAYLLGPGEAPGVTIEPVSKARATALILENTFLLDIEGPASLRRHFDDLTTLAADVPCFQLDYPRRYDVLAQVRSEVSEHAARLA